MALIIICTPSLSKLRWKQIYTVITAFIYYQIDYRHLHQRRDSSYFYPINSYINLKTNT